jgi:hypothetical protein
MIRTTILAAAGAALIALGVPAPAQARMASPGLNTEMPAATQDVQYRRYRYSNRRYEPRRHRYCSNQRVRVRVAGGRFVVRTQRHCGWRRW